MECRRVLCRAAVSSPVSTLAEVAQARAEVDRVLDGTSGDVRVTTLADSRTPVLLGEIMDTIAADEQLHDPRVDALDVYDRPNGSHMSQRISAIRKACVREGTCVVATKCF